VIASLSPPASLRAAPLLDKEGKTSSFSLPTLGRVMLRYQRITFQSAVADPVRPRCEAPEGSCGSHTCPAIRGHGVAFLELLNLGKSRDIGKLLERRHLVTQVR